VTQQTTEFRRARSEEQRQIRRDVILRTAAAMVAEMPVADLSLNELSRRVGLAKSNVLRYFESREAILLELLDTAWKGWLARLDAALPHVDDDSERVAAVVTGTLVDDHLFCALISVSAAVLERNVSPEIAKRYKLSAIANTNAFAELLHERLPRLGIKAATYFSAGTLVSITGLYPLAQPSEAMLCVYEDPEMAVLRLDLATALREMLATLLAGCLIRWPANHVTVE
jgi:AcrR family transcriptional regulator